MERTSAQRPTLPQQRLQSSVVAQPSRVSLGLVPPSVSWPQSPVDGELAAVSRFVAGEVRWRSLNRAEV